MTKLYVGNLPYSYDENALRQLFASYGELTSATIIVDKMSGRSKGFGFVEMDDGQANSAIAELNGKDVDGRALVVSVARPMTERPQREFRRDNNRSGGGFKSRY
jgi:RNA recognition motif-containing protein